ncbi:MAG: 3-isopropylmalate dehydratase small subunit [Alphaproteobacteria bacterium]|nr:3-isopropylmalate dehydratase small subunit [Alphaproteobacteria bacterium]
MQPFKTLTAKAAYLPISNIDTDMLVPKQYLKTVKRSGLGRVLFAEQRYDADGAPRPDFVLNKNPDVQILMAGENFGCGSSREHAPWALADFGIRVIIAPSFADIFYNNCFKNGILPLRLRAQEIEELRAKDMPITVDLENQRVTQGRLSFQFEIQPSCKEALLEGLDEIEKVLKLKGEIEAFERKHFEEQPWLGTFHA